MTRHYRAVAVDTWTPKPAGLARAGHLHTERAERQLRERLEAGERPTVMLVSPEQARPAEIASEGRVRAVFAWAPTQPTDNGLRHIWTHHPHVTAELDATDHTPDPVSRYYADGGSVLVGQGRLRQLRVSGWLAPVAVPLAERYGVSVDVDSAPVLDPAPAFGEAASLIPDLMPAELVDLLTANPPGRNRYLAEEDPRSQGVNAPRVAWTPPPQPWLPVISQLLAVVSDTLKVPVNSGEYAVLEYQPGEKFSVHTDLTDDPDTWDRTASFSLLLNEPGLDFDGGDLSIKDKVVEMHRGDLLCFTACTPHSVSPVTRGRRLVLVAFGEWRR